MARAIRLERALYGSLRDYILHSSANSPGEQVQLGLAMQFVEGVAHVHQRGVIWGDLSVRNALLFEDWRLKLGDFTDSDLFSDYPSDWYGCEVRYCPPGSDRPQSHNTNTIKRELFAFGAATYEIVEWKVPYGPQDSVPGDEVIEALVACKQSQLTCGNPAESVIRQCWGYMYESSCRIASDLKSLYSKYTKESQVYCAYVTPYSADTHSDGVTRACIDGNRLNHQFSSTL